MTLDELASKCKCGVHLTVNEYKNYYETMAEKFNELDQTEGGTDWAAGDEKNEIVKRDSIVELQYYKHTPIGFTKIVTFSVEDALRQAAEDFE